MQRFFWSLSSPFPLCHRRSSMVLPLDMLSLGTLPLAFFSFSTPTQMHAHTHKCTHTCKDAHTHTHTHLHMHTHMHMLVNTSPSCTTTIQYLLNGAVQVSSRPFVRQGCTINPNSSLRPAVTGLIQFVYASKLWAR